MGDNCTAAREGIFSIHLGVVMVLWRVQEACSPPQAYKLLWKRRFCNNRKWVFFFLFQSSFEACGELKGVTEGRKFKKPFPLSSSTIVPIQFP